MGKRLRKWLGVLKEWCDRVVFWIDSWMAPPGWAVLVVIVVLIVAVTYLGTRPPRVSVVKETLEVTVEATRVVQETVIVTREVPIEVTRVVRETVVVEKEVLVETPQEATAFVEASEPVSVSLGYEEANRLCTEGFPGGAFYEAAGLTVAQNNPVAKFVACFYLRRGDSFYTVKDLTCMEGVPDEWDDLYMKNRPFLPAGTEVYPRCRTGNGWVLVHPSIPGFYLTYVEEAGIVPSSGLESVRLCEDYETLDSPYEGPLGLPSPPVLDLPSWSEEEVRGFAVFIAAGDQHPWCFADDVARGWVIIEVPRDFEAFDLEKWVVGDATGSPHKVLERHTEPGLGRFSLLVEWVATGEDAKVFYEGLEIRDLKLPACWA